MEVFNIVCGQCGSHSFKVVEGKNTCQGCGYFLTDKDTENILSEAFKIAKVKETETKGKPHRMDVTRLNKYADSVRCYSSRKSHRMNRKSF